MLGGVAGVLGFGEDCGQCGPGRVVEGLLGVVGQDHEDPLGVPFHGACRRLALSQGGQEEFVKRGVPRVSFFFGGRFRGLRHVGGCLRHA
ncbi:hypothetical protein ADK41_03035 [Streptomyces caelestis]|uniref:Uncharacterized protein n=1 Tax=Streptomyces caelestis TaxID=36816 RepID=A0A0M9XB32_9ACTN|nr:hypothetical protein ADK41_03035 [Streptomyces caelestis]